MNELDKKIVADNERRAAPRYKVNLPAPVLITAIKTSATKQEQYLVLRGRTLDVSISGLALIISNKDYRALIGLGRDCELRLLLPLPAAAIELEVTPVRYQQLDASETGEVLVGTQITDMKGRDRAMFMNFINDFE